MHLLRMNNESPKFFKDALDGLPSLADQWLLVVYHKILVYYVVNI